MLLNTVSTPITRVLIKGDVQGDVHHLVNMRRLLFLKRSEGCSNKVIQECIVRYKSQSCEFIEVQKQFNIDINWSAPKIKALTYVAFKNIVC